MILSTETHLKVAAVFIFI